MKSLSEKIGAEAEAFFKKLNAGRYNRYFNRIALSAIFSSYLSLSCSSSTGSFYRDINRSLEENPLTSNVVIDEPKSHSLDDYQLYQSQDFQLEQRKQYNGRRNDSFSLEEITDEGLRRDVRMKLNKTDENDFRRISRRIKRFSPILESRSKRYDIDDNLLAGVTYHESAGNPEARSRKGALGLMQVTYGAVSDVTGRKPKDITRREVMNPENNIEFGTSYLSDLIERYGNVVLGLAAYNLGPTKLDRILNKLSKNKHIRPEQVGWYDIKYMLPRETREYVPGVLSKVLKMQGESSVESYATAESKQDYIN